MSGQGYQPSIGNGTTVLPSPTTFAQYFIAAGSNVQLAWPIDNFPANSNVVAELMNVQALGDNASLQMPAATGTSLGEKTLIFNSGQSTVNLNDVTGHTIIGIQPGIAIYIGLTDNTTTAGAWLTFTFGAGVAAANAAALAGNGLSANGIFLQQIMQVHPLSTNYTVGPADRDLLFNWTSGAGTINLPSVASVGNNFYIQIRNSGSGTLTLDAAGSELINGSLTLSMSIGDSCFLVTDGTAWYTLGLGQTNTNLFNFQVVSLAGQTGTYVLPANLQNKVAYRFTGALAGDTIIQVPATIQQYWIDNQTSAHNLSIATAAQIGGGTPLALTTGARYIAYCDSNNVLNADTGGLATPITISQGGTGAASAGAALTNLGGTSVGVAVFTAATIAAAQSAMQVPSLSDMQVWGLIH